MSTLLATEWDSRNTVKTLFIYVGISQLHRPFYIVMQCAVQSAYLLHPGMTLLKLEYLQGGYHIYSLCYNVGLSFVWVVLFMPCHVVGFF